MWGGKGYPASAGRGRNRPTSQEQDKPTGETCSGKAQVRLTHPTSAVDSFLSSHSSLDPASLLSSFSSSCSRATSNSVPHLSSFDDEKFPGTWLSLHPVPPVHSPFVPTAPPVFSWITWFILNYLFLLRGPCYLLQLGKYAKIWELPFIWGRWVGYITFIPSVWIRNFTAEVDEGPFWCGYKHPVPWQTYSWISTAEKVGRWEICNCRKTGCLYRLYL